MRKYALYLEDISNLEFFTLKISILEEFGKVKKMQKFEDSKLYYYVIYIHIYFGTN